MTQWEALEAMPAALRERLNNGPFTWDPYSVLRYYRKQTDFYGPERALRIIFSWLDNADEKEASKPWRAADGSRIPSPTAYLRVSSMTLDDLL